MLNTTWEIWDYDVWGNEEEGYTVNNRFNVYREYPIACPVSTYNRGKKGQFSSATPTDEQIREALDISPTVQIETTGDDLSIYVNEAETGYPLGEMLCTSHASLSRIRKEGAK